MIYSNFNLKLVNIFDCKNYIIEPALTIIEKNCISYTILNNTIELNFMVNSTEMYELMKYKKDIKSFVIIHKDYNDVKFQQKIKSIYKSYSVSGDNTDNNYKYITIKLIYDIKSFNSVHPDESFNDEKEK